MKELKFTIMTTEQFDKLYSSIEDIWHIWQLRTDMSDLEDYESGDDVSKYQKIAAYILATMEGSSFMDTLEEMAGEYRIIPD